MVENQEEEKDKKKTSEVSVVEFVKQKGNAIQLPDGTIVDVDPWTDGQAIVISEILRRIIKIEKNIA